LNNKAEEARQQALDDAKAEEAEESNSIKQSPSELSIASVDLYLPQKAIFLNDKDCTSVKSDCRLEFNCRRFSIVNSKGQKVS